MPVYWQLAGQAACGDSGQFAINEAPTHWLSDGGSPVLNLTRTQGDFAAIMPVLNLTTVVSDHTCVDVR
jgi:hypothetical protein